MFALPLQKRKRSMEFHMILLDESDRPEHERSNSAKRSKLHIPNPTPASCQRFFSQLFHLTCDFLAAIIIKHCKRNYVTLPIECDSRDRGIC
jgi:hypothetical protein